MIKLLENILLTVLFFRDYNRLNKKQKDNPQGQMLMQKGHKLLMIHIEEV